MNSHYLSTVATKKGTEPWFNPRNIHSISVYYHMIRNMDPGEKGFSATVRTLFDYMFRTMEAIKNVPFS